MILYLGNKLSKHGKAASVIELLTPKLQAFSEIKSFSEKKNQFARLAEMLWAIISLRKRISLVLIDAYSSNAFWYTYFVASVCQQFNIPYIPILHGGDFPNRLSRSKRACHQIFSKAAINISPSFYLKEHFERENFVIEYIPNFLEIEKYPFRSRENFSPRLLWVRSFHKLYNPTLAIDVLKEVKQVFPLATLCMIGPDKDGSLALTKNKVIELGLGDAVTFTGMLAKEEWTRRSIDFDVFINTTNFDNMPISVIEAMALGLAIVSTNVGGLPYLIEHEKDGLLVRAGSSKDFSESIQRVITDPAYAKLLVDNARQKAEGFDWQSLQSKWQNVITKYGRKI